METLATNGVSVLPEERGAMLCCVTVFDNSLRV